MSIKPLNICVKEAISIIVITRAKLPYIFPIIFKNSILSESTFNLDINEFKNTILYFLRIFSFNLKVYYFLFIFKILRTTLKFCLFQEICLCLCVLQYTYSKHTYLNVLFQC